MESSNAARATDIVNNQTQGRKFRGLSPRTILALACLGLYYNSIGSWYFTDPGESYYTEAAREMVECNNWIVPHLNYQIYFSKPILTFWLIAGAYKLLGASEFAARLPFSIAATIMVFATYLACKRLIGEKPALLAALIAGSAPLGVVFTRTSPIDLLFCACLNVAVLGFAMSVFAGSSRWAYALWAALGLAVITKGPAGLVFFALGTLLFLICEKPPLRTLWTWFLATRPLVGLAIFAAITVPWYWAVWKATKGLFLQVFIFYENFARLAGKTNIHKSSWFFFIPVLAYGFAPWSLVLAQTVKMGFGEPFVERWFGGGRMVFKSTYRPHMKSAAAYTDAPAGEESTAGEEGASRSAKKKKNKVKAEPQALPQPEIERLSIYYLATWSLAIFVFFSLSKTQLDTYIQPILTPLAVLTAYTAAKLCEIQNGDDQKLADKLKLDAAWISVFGHICAWGSGIAGLAFVAGTIFPFLPFYPSHRLWLFVAALCAFGGARAQFASLRKKDTVESLTRLALTTTAITSCLVPVVFQISGLARQDNMVALARQLRGSKEEIALFGTYMPSAMYYMQRPVDYLSDVGQFSVATTPLPKDGFCYGPTPSGRRQLIMGDNKHMEAFKEKPELQLKEIARQGDWAVYDLTNGYAERPRRLEETFRFLLNAGHSFSDTSNYGPLTVPLGSGDADWFKYKQFRKH